MDAFIYPEWYRGPKDLKLFISFIYQIILHKQGKTSYMHGIMIGDPLPHLTQKEMGEKMMEAKKLLDAQSKNLN